MSAFVASRCRGFCSRATTAPFLLGPARAGETAPLSSVAAASRLSATPLLQLPACRVVASLTGCDSQLAPHSAAWQHLPFAARGLASAAGNNEKKGAEDRLTQQEEPFDTITDKIPEKPVGVVEGTSYSVVILAGLALAAATVWAVVKELLLEPKEYTVFNKTLEYIKSDPRVTVRLGGNISGYGADSRNRAARQRIPNRIYTDSSGVEHVQVQFQAKGSSCGATVHADMYVDKNKEWKYTYLYVDVDAPYPQRLVLVNPQYAAVP